MGGKSKKTTVGYWYMPMFHHGLGVGPIDAFLEFRAGDRTAWAGQLTDTGTINVNAPNLFGGEKDQGGIVGDMEVLFGKADQQPNSYLLTALGNQIPAWRGIATVVWKGGKYGAMNPYPQPASYKIMRVMEGWDGECWYAEAVQIIGKPSVTVGVWRHVEMSCAGNVVRLFVGGQLVAQHVLDFEPNGGSGGQSTIGRYSALSSDGGVFTGYLRNVRVTKDVRHTDDFTPSVATPSSGNDPFWSSVISMLPLTGPVGSTTFDDAKGNPWTLYDGTVTMSDGASLDGQPSAHFTGGNIRTPYTAGLNVGSSFTIDFWVLAESLSGLPVPVCWNQYHGIHAGYHFRLLSTGLVGVGFGLNYWPAEPIYLDENIGRNILGMNPAHILYYAATNPELGREPIAGIDDVSFRTGADWFYSQGFGICTSWDPSAESAEEFSNRIQKIAACSVSRDITDGKLHLDIANGVYDLASLPVLTDDDILDWNEQPTAFDGAINSVSVKYFDPEKKVDVITPPVQALALIDAYGVIHQTFEYPEIPTGDLALRVAERELRASVTPLRTFDLKTTRAAYALRPNQYMRLQCHRRAIADMVCIVASKQTGSLKSGAISLVLSQDIYSMPLTSVIEVEHGMDTTPSQTPVAITSQAAFEAPYIEIARTIASTDLAALSAEASYVIAVADDPANSLNYTMMVQPASGEYTAVDDAEWCPTALVVEGDTTRTATTFTLADGRRLGNVVLGSAALWGSEIVRVDALDTSGITIGRGCADTVAAVHPPNDRIWFYDDVAASDTTEYVAGETLNVKLLPNTGSQQLPASAATPISIQMQGRASLPYPPAGVRIAAASWPDTVAGEFAVTWAHRDRVAQADQLIDDAQPAVTLPQNQRYGLRFSDGAGTVLAERTDIGAGTATVALAYTGTVVMTLWTIDEIGESLQQHTHTFAYTPPSPLPTANTITATAYTPYVPTWVIDGNGSA